MKKILVTGSSGMIGTAFCEELLKRKIDFVGLDKRQNIWNKDIDDKTIHMDLLDEYSVAMLSHSMSVCEFDIIVHLAANARVYDLISETGRAVDNVAMTNNVYEIAKYCKIKKVIVASSREVYGEALKKGNKKLKEEDSNHLVCSNQYAASKIFLEALAKASKTVFDIDSVILRFSNVYGKYDTSDRFVPLMILKMLKNTDVRIYGGKEKKMDFTYIDDTVQGIFTTIENFDKMKISNKNFGVYNVSSGISTELYDVAQYIKTTLKSKSKIKLVKNRPGEPMYYVADISKISKFKYKPKYSILKGLYESINYYKELYAQPKFRTKITPISNLFRSETID